MNKNEYCQIRNQKKSRISESIRDRVFDAASDPIPFGLTNDYMFRAVFQSNNKALKGLLCSLLHLADSEVHSVEVTNPILLGEAIGSKAFHLDIHLLLNDSTRINLEMQVANRLNWPDRSVMYLCRTYDKLNRGQEYAEAKPAVHIGFLDYTLFAEHPEFYATYKLINVKSHHVYSDSLTLYVADLTRIELATQEDRQYHIDSWARLMKAKTWEELRMTAEEDEALYEAAKALFYNSSEEEIRLRCLDREEYYQDLRNYERKIEQDHIEYEEDIRAYQKTIEQNRIEHEQDIRAYQKTIEQNRIEHEQDIQAYQKTLAEKEEAIERLRAEIQQLKQRESTT